MASIYTGPDALRWYHTGATADGALQPYGRVSLGAFRSGTQVVSLGHRLVGALAGVRVDYVSGANGAGNGALEAVDADTLRWTAPGSATPGAEVEIANGETKMLQDGDTASAFLIVTRTGAADLGGSCVASLGLAYGGVVGFDDVALGVDSDIDYRCVAVANHSGADVTGLVVTAIGSGVSVGVETPINDMVQDRTCTGDEVAPAGVGFAASATFDVPAGEWRGVWIRRDVSGASASARVEQGISWAFSAGGETYSGEARGWYRVADATLSGYRVYLGVDGAGFDFAGEAYATGATLPIVLDALDPAHAYEVVTRYRNAYGLESQNAQAQYAFELDGDGLIVLERPSAPFSVSAAAGAGGVIEVRASYDYRSDGDTAGDTWLVYVTDTGVDPDPSSDTPVEVALRQSGAAAELVYATSAFADETEVRVLVRVRRTVGENTADSLNTAAVTATAETDGPTISRVACGWEGRSDYDAVVVWEDENDTTNYIEQVPGALRFYIGGALVAALGASGLLHTRAGVKTQAFAGTSVAASVSMVDGEMVFGVGDGPFVKAMTIDAAGNVTVSSVQTSAGEWPRTDVTVDEEALIEWHEGAGLDFSKDGATVGMRLASVVSAGYTNGRLEVLGVRTYGI